MIYTDLAFKQRKLSHEQTITGTIRAQNSRMKCGNQTRRMVQFLNQAPIIYST